MARETTAATHDAGSSGAEGAALPERRVLVTTRSFGTGDGDPAGRLEAAGLRVDAGPADHDFDTLRPLLADAVAWIAGAGRVTAQHLDAARGMHVLARYGTGVDAVDLAAAAARGVVVTNTPGANAEAVADHAVALMLATLRSLIPSDRATRMGGSPPGRGRELGTVTVGIAGFGAVGQAVARRAACGFGSRVLAYDPYVSVAGMARHRVEPVSELARLAGSSDVLTLHLPARDGPVIDETLLTATPRDAVLINTARAGLVDEGAVAAALQDGRLAGAGIDVFSGPDSPLLTAPCVIATPHVAAQTVQAVDRMGETAADEVLRVLSGEEPHHPVRV